MNIIDLEFKSVYVNNNFIKYNEGSCFLESPLRGCAEFSYECMHMLLHSEMKIHNFF